MTTASLSISRTSSLYDHGQAQSPIDAREQVSDAEKYAGAIRNQSRQISDKTKALFFVLCSSYLVLREVESTSKVPSTKYNAPSIRLVAHWLAFGLISAASL